ncbi:MAG: single-stranded-DNA-specific exonuclease [Candidatus Peribacteria bacterium]|nr:single-stranded-DNA-specific exonuclease [Candidatus Peribacteria bacterium]
MSLLSFTGKRWIPGTDMRSALAVPGCDVSATVVQLLQQERQLRTATDNRQTKLLYPDMQRAVERTWQAVDRQEKVMIFGDYDCDGITSAAQLVRFFRRHAVQPLVRLPNRLTEGYGLKDHHIQEVLDANIQLLITADTGIASVEEIRRAKEAGIDVIILDHHTMHAEIPAAYAILHPLLSADFPRPYPAAAGVVYAFVRSLEEARGNPLWTDCDTDAALAAIGTIADLVELKGENRRLVQEGIAALARCTSGPLALLVSQAGLGTAITSRDVAFRLAPRINAAGRMDNPAIALAALLGDDLSSLPLLDELNQRRQQQVRGFMTEASASFIGSTSPLIFLARPEYSSGIVGLIAGKLTETFGKPSFVGSIQGGTCTASLRSIPAYNIAEGLSRVSDVLTHFGGHAQAAGCHLPVHLLSELERRLAADIAGHVDASELSPFLVADVILDPRHISARLHADMCALEPFGQGNLEPRFLLPGVMLGDVRRCGADGAHLQAKLHAHKLIGFGLGHIAHHVNQPVDLLCRIGMDTYMGRTSVQLFVDDVRVAREMPVMLPIETITGLV